MPMKREFYPANWKAISRRIREERAGDRCECRGECGEHAVRRCGAPNGQLVRRERERPWSWWYVEVAPSVPDELKPPIKVVLTVAHLCRDPGCADEAHLRAMCQRCHLLYDRFQHGANAAATRRRRHAERSGQLPLLGEKP
jgi:hypothetical protein